MTSPGGGSFTIFLVATAIVPGGSTVWRCRGIVQSAAGGLSWVHRQLAASVCGGSGEREGRRATPRISREGWRCALLAFEDVSRAVGKPLLAAANPSGRHPRLGAKGN